MEGQIKPSDVVEFFEKSSLDAANIVFDMVKAKVDARNQKSKDAKAKQAKAGGAAAAAPKKAKTTGPKKSHKKKPAAPAPLPLGDPAGAGSAMAEAGDAPTQEAQP